MGSAVVDRQGYGRGLGGQAAQGGRSRSAAGDLLEGDGEG